MKKLHQIYFLNLFNKLQWQKHFSCFDTRNIFIFQNTFNFTIEELLFDPQLEVIFLQNYVF